MLNLTPTRQAVIEQWLAEDLIIWLTTVDPSGRPHSVPVWFWWDGEQITIFSQPETRKARRDPFEDEGMLERAFDPARIDLGPERHVAAVPQRLPIGADDRDRRKARIDPRRKKGNAAALRKFIVNHV